MSNIQGSWHAGPKMKIVHVEYSYLFDVNDGFVTRQIWDTIWNKPFLKNVGTNFCKYVSEMLYYIVFLW